MMRPDVEAFLEEGLDLTPELRAQRRREFAHRFPTETTGDLLLEAMAERNADHLELLLAAFVTLGFPKNFTRCAVTLLTEEWDGRHGEPVAKLQRPKDPAAVPMLTVLAKWTPPRVGWDDYHGLNKQACYAVWGTAVDATLGLMPPDCRRAGITLRDNGVDWLFYFYQPPAATDWESMQDIVDDMGETVWCRDEEMSHSWTVWVTPYRPSHDRSTDWIYIRRHHEDFAPPRSDPATESPAPESPPLQAGLANLARNTLSHVALPRHLMSHALDQTADGTLLRTELCGMHEDDPAAFAEIFTALAHQTGPGSTAGMRIRYV